MTKKELRVIYKEKRNSLSYQQRNKHEDLILIGFQRLAIHIPDHILTYAAFRDEYDPQLVTDYCNFRNPAMQLYYPVVNGDDVMTAVLVNDYTHFAPNRYGIDEPVDGMPIFPGELEMVIVPLLAFDERGYRVGYGKGYYDRFLHACDPGVLKIGFSFFEACEQIDDTGDHDIKLDYCITPGKIYSFND